MKFRTNKIAPAVMAVALAFGVAACEGDDTVDNEVQDAEETVEEPGEELEEEVEDDGTESDPADGADAGTDTDAGTETDSEE